MSTVGGGIEGRQLSISSVVEIDPICTLRCGHLRCKRCLDFERGFGNRPTMIERSSAHVPEKARRASSQEGTVRANPLKEALRRGEVQIGTWLNMAHSPAILQLLKSAGLDYARVDLEHASTPLEAVADMALLSRALDFPILVRPPAANREWITRLLDAGVWGLHIPQVDTPAVAKAVVDAARYAPLGHRGMAGLGPHNDFDPDADIETLGDEVHITVMLESKEAFDNLEEIIATPGIDAVTLGPHDLAQDLGVAGSPDEVAVIDGHRELMISVAAKHGKDVAMLCSTVTDAVRWAEAGARIIVFSSEVDVLHKAYVQVVNSLDELRGAR